MGLAPLVAGVVGSLVEAWLTGEMPSPKSSFEENMERIQNIFIGLLAGFAIGYMFELAGVKL